MPVTKGKYQCQICDDIFEAKSGAFSKCNCGESEIEPSYFGYSYRNGNKVKTIEQDSYYLEDEFVKLPEDIQEIYDEIKQIKKETGYKFYLHEMTDEGENGEKYLSIIHISYTEFISKHSNEKNEISLELSLRKESYKGDQNAKLRLSRFLDLMKKIESEEFNVAKRKELIELADKEGIYYTEEPTGDTNYKFYI